MPKKNTGLVATLAVVLAFFGLSSLPKKTGEEASAAQRKNGAVKAETKKSTGPTPNSSCDEIKDRLQRFASQMKLPDSCFENKTDKTLTGLRPGVSLQFFIAIVPNPETTHLQLFFDRSIEIIQQAAQDESYSYDSSWFPWDDSGKEYELRSDQLAEEQTKEIREGQPGVMVFRSNPSVGYPPGSGPKSSPPYEKGIVVFVVGEQPTRGITDEQFKNALGWINTLTNNKSDKSLRILGPSFSGSLPSLALQLDNIKPAFSRVDIASGSVTSESSYRWFRQFLTERGLGEFNTFMESDAVLINRFRNYLTEEGYAPRQIAILSEDETAFGQAAPKEGGADAEKKPPPVSGPVYLYYPRDIASLRSAYEKQSIFSSSSQTANQTTPGTMLRGDLSEPANSEHDTVRTYGGQLTPLAQESILLAIVDVLKEKHIQFVVVRSSNSLDQIFLSQFLRRLYPEGRVVLDGADILFTRGAEGASMRGVMTLTTYPLIGREQDWTASLRSESSAYRIFGQDVVEGLYGAARQMFRSAGIDEKTNAVAIKDYAAPQWAIRANDNQMENQHASVWISVISNRQFWPLATLNANTVPETDSGNSVLLPLENQHHGTSTIDELPFEMTVLLLVCVGWGIWHLYACWRGPISKSPRTLLYFAPLPGLAHKGLMFTGSMLLGLLAFVLAAGGGVFSRDLGPHPRLILIVLTLILFGLSYLACVGNFKLPVIHGQSVASDSYNGWWPVAAFGLVVMVGLLSLTYYKVLLCPLRAANSFPTFWRCVHIFSGVSPLLPQILLLAGMYGWFWFGMRGLSVSGDDRPLLPKLDDLPKLSSEKPSMAMFAQDGAGSEIETAALMPSRAYLGKLALIFFLTLGVCSTKLQGITIRSLGERKFGTMILGGLCLCIALALANTWQMFCAWKLLRRLLVSLDHTPLRRTLCALKGLTWRSVWTMGGNIAEERYRIISRQLETLRHLRNLIAKDDPENELSYDKKEAILNVLDPCQMGADDFVAWYLTLPKDKYLSDLTPMRKFQEQLAATAAFVMTKILSPAWRAETESLLFDRSDQPSKDDQLANHVPVTNVPAYVRAAEEFFVLPYLGFIQNVLNRLRSIILGSLFVFLGATLSVSSYPFDPRPVLAGAFLFVLCVAGVAVTIVYAQMHRDNTLSHITNTKPGELGPQFWIHLFTFGVGPLLGVITTLFPSITDFVVSWLQPSMQLAK
jgi:hypothetical protein